MQYFCCMEFNGFIEEMSWRGMHQNHTPGIEKYLRPGAKGYIGFDPTADSLTLGNLVPLMILAIFQKHGHQPIVLMGGATGRIGDPSGKDKERKLKSPKEIDANVAAQEKQIRKLLDFESQSNPAILINNYSFYKNMNVLDFLRDVGKTLTVNYMMSKESVKKRIETGISFTEFSYQLLQGYDFQVLYNTENCALQMGGSDQWGNITAGTEFIRRNSGGKAYAFTTPLLTKSDGSKMGKSESGAIWLSADKTSTYAFYQYLLNCADADLKNLIKFFSLKSRSEMQAMIDQIPANPRKIKKLLAEELTARIHGIDAVLQVDQVSTLLFAKKLNKESVSGISKEAFEIVAKEIPCHRFFVSSFSSEKTWAEFLTKNCPVFNSKGEFRRSVKGNALSINKTKITDPEAVCNESDLLHDKYILIENGKKNKSLLVKE